MAEQLDLEGRWPDLFEGLDAEQRRSVVQALANGWHEGWVPNREDVEILTDSARGSIDFDGVRRRALDSARRRASSTTQP